MGVLEAEGIKFEMGITVDVQKLPAGFDAYCICTGTPQARDLNIPGRELKGIYLALEMLSQQNHILDGETFPKERLVNAKGKRVLVIGGGDTGSDCIGTSIRQGAVSVTQIEIMPQPPVGHNDATLATMAHCTEDDFKSRRRLHAPLVAGIQSVYWQEWKSLRCRGGRSGMDSGSGWRTPYHETYRKEGSDRRRYGTSGHGLPETGTTGISGKCIRSR